MRVVHINVSDNGGLDDLGLPECPVSCSTRG
jgi:hypothetical protein